MATWTDYSNLFPEDHQDVVSALVTTYAEDFSITDYVDFAAQSNLTIKTQLASLGDSHPLLLAIADYYLAKAGEIESDGEGGQRAWDLLMLKMPIESFPATKKLRAYFDAVPTEFGDFQAMSSADLAATFGLADSLQWWTNFALGLTRRNAVLSDTEFGGFVLGLPLADRTAVESFLQMVVASDAGFDTSAFLAMTQEVLAGKLQSLNVNQTFRNRWAQRVINTVRDLIHQNCPENQFESRFVGSVSPQMRDGLHAVMASIVNQWGRRTTSTDTIGGDTTVIPAIPVTSLRDVAYLAIDDIVTEIGNWNSSHMFFHGVAAQLISDFQDYQRMLAEQAKVPVTAIAVQVRSTNADARPLGGLLVKVTDVSVAGSPVVLGTRMLDMRGIAFVQYAGEVDAVLSLTFEVMTADEESLVTSDALELDLGEDGSIEVEVAVPGVPVNSGTIAALATALGITIPSALGAFMEANEIELLDSIRRLGGLSLREDSAVQDNLVLCQLLDNHAKLELISNDAALRTYLIGAGYTDAGKIARKTRVDFVTELVGVDFGEVALAGVYLKAAKVDAVLGHLMMARGAGHASGYKGEAPLNPTLAEIFETQCDCAECKSGVSPLAYLAALLDYGTRYIKDDGASVDVDWFQKTFHQGFCELPANCKAVEKKVCQVRIAIEVLRQHIGATDIAYPYRKPYLEMTYGLLLNQAGVTVEEVRLARFEGSGSALLESVASRLGIAAVADKVHAFYLDSTGGTPTLTEDALELLFGIQSTLRNPYSDGLKLGDGGDLVRSWQFDGVEYGRNTDADGFVYLKLVASPNPAVEVYRDSSRGSDDLVASAAVSAGSPLTAELVPHHDSGLSGRIELVPGYPNNQDIQVSVVPKLLAWRLQWQRERWMAQDWPKGNTYFLADRTLPIIEPDWMGPDDMRSPTAGSGPSHVKVYDVWLNRRDWVDGVISSLESLAGEMNDMFDMMNGVGWSEDYTSASGGTASTTSPWDSGSISGFTSWDTLFVGLHEDLASPVAATRNTAVDVVQDDLRLTLNEFEVLYGLYERYLAVTPALPPFSEEDFDDLHGILCQAAKRASYSMWIGEEDSDGLALGPADFWVSLHEPKEGKWNRSIAWRPFYASFIATPYVDPVEVGLLDLPEPPYASAAISLYQARLAEIVTRTGQIFDARTSGTSHYLEMVDEALAGLPSYLGSTSASMSGLLTDLNETGSTYDDALEVVNQQFFLTEAEFRDAMKVVSKEVTAPTTVTDADYAALAKVLVHGWRRKNWVAWRSAESGLSYWEGYKQRLPKWRSNKSLRKLWTEGLAFYSRMPMVDPDLIKAGDIVNPEFNGNATLDNAAYVRWRDRDAETTGWLADIAAASLNDNVETYVGVTTTEVTELRDLYEQNKDVSARMAQLNLNPTRLTLLAKLIDLGSGSSGDWDACWAMLVQIQKERNYGVWNVQERTDGICLSPDYFHPPYENYLQYHQYLAAILVPWRTSAAARRDWQDKLDARIDQERSVIEGMAATVKSTEDRVLITLRDALILQSGATGSTLADKGEWLTEKFLMDFRIQCCNETTRVAQAIETLQVLYFSIRIGAIVDDYPNLAMPANDNWDDDWQWLGTYGTWRSLMFVYLYPENVLMPSLKEKKSGKLAGLMDAVRNSSRFTPDMACEVLHSYEEYLKDMVDLRLGAAVTATMDNQTDGCGLLVGQPREVDFLFAIGGHTLKMYVKMVTNHSFYGDDQSHWEQVPGMADICNIVGATLFRGQNGKRYVYVFGLRPVHNQRPALIANRFNLDAARWESDLDDLKIEGEPGLSTATLVLAERMREDLPIYFVATSYEWASKFSNGVPGATVYDIKFYDWTAPKDRLMLYNRMNGTGDAWAYDAWKFTGFNWMQSLCLVAAIYTAEKYLQVIFAAEYLDDQWQLATHTFNEVSASFAKPPTVRVIPPLLSFGVGVSDFVTAAYNMYLTAGDQVSFRGYCEESDKLRNECALTDFSESLQLLGYSPNADQFKLYYNQSGSGPRNYLTEVISFELAVRFTDNRSDNPTYSTSQGAAYPKRVLALLNAQSAAYTTDIRFYGPFRNYASTATVRRTLQYLTPDRPIATVVSNWPVRYRNLFSATVHPLLEHPTSQSSATRKVGIAQMFAANASNSVQNRSYLQEGYYLLPMFVALELQKGRHYEEALELFRLVYDYTLPLADRKIYRGLVEEESINTSFVNVMSWLDNPENPHTIAGMRANTYTRFTVFSIVRCMLEMADQEFTFDSPESVPRARTLYLAARELIRDEIYEIENEGCGAMLDDLDVLVTDAGWYPEWLRLKAAIAAMNNHDVIDAVVNGFDAYGGGIAAVFANTSLSWEQRIMDAEAIYEFKLNLMGSAPNRLCNVVTDWSIAPNLLDLVLTDDDTGTGMNRISGQVGDGFMSQLALLTGKTIEELSAEDDLPWLAEAGDAGAGEPLNLSLKQRLKGEQGYYEAYYEQNPLSGLRTGSGLKRPFIPYSNHYFCVPQNPVPFNLLLHAELNLFKIRHCRNIAGIHRELDPYGAPTDTTSGMPVIGANGQIAFPGTVSVPPTPYRYEVVLARAKELVQLAAQAEGALLNTLEKLDAERYSLLRARQDLGTAKATVKLQDLRVKESEHEVDLAEMQQDRAQEQLDTYQGWLSEGIPSFEKLIIQGYRNLAGIRQRAALLGFGLQELQYAREMMTFSFQGSELFNPETTGAIIGYVGLLAGSVALGALQLNNQINSIGEETNISINQMYASWEQRKREYTFQAAMSVWDVKLAGQQIKLANDRMRITGQERAIAQMQADQAEETLEFLRTKFTNADLYDWMSGVLQRIYNFYLQHATSMAKIAQQQLAFERQEAPANLILDDYWSPPSDSANVPGVNSGSGPDRRGLTGSARLQMDLTKLDLYSFETEKRKLQLTKTLSLAQLFPAEFEVFRQTGVLTFRTRMEWFDRDFPGHYLRLIKRVRTSVIALVPPGEGIRARLATTGVSRVVVGGDAFQTIVTRRGSESVSLTSPVEATGLFEMLPDRGDMLYPFEGMGVDAPWEFRMYRAANPINFNTIADVLITLEYTALESFDYEQQVIGGFDNLLHGERAFSFRYLLPDQWYDLRNPLLTSTPSVVNFQLGKGDFPGLAGLKVENVTLMVITNEVGPKPMRDVGLVKLDGTNVVGGGVATTNTAGVASTRSGASTTNLQGIYSGNATAWTNMIGDPHGPFGSWRLDCSDGSIAGLFASEVIQDILLIVGYKGDSPGY